MSSHSFTNTIWDLIVCLLLGPSFSPERKEGGSHANKWTLLCQKVGGAVVPEESEGVCLSLRPPPSATPWLTVTPLPQQWACASWGFCGGSYYGRKATAAFSHLHHFSYLTWNIKYSRTESWKTSPEISRKGQRGKRERRKDSGSGNLTFWHGHSRALYKDLKIWWCGSEGLWCLFFSEVTLKATKEVEWAYPVYSSC